MAGEMQLNLDIVNMALNRIGQPSLTTFPETTTTFGRAATGPIYAATIKEVLRTLPWACAITRADAVSSTRSPAAPTGDFQKSAPVPTGFLRLLDIGGNKEIPFRLECSTILHNLTDANIVVRYVKYMTVTADAVVYPDVASWDPILCEAIVSRLATKLVTAVSGKPELVPNLYQEYMVALAAAKAVAVVESKESVADILGFWTDMRFVMAKPRNEVSE